MLSAAFEAPLDDEDAQTLGSEALRRAAELPELEHTPAGYVWKGRDYPAARVSLRSGDGEAFTVVDGETGSLLGLVERDRAYSTVHEGAVYLHLGEQYLVESLSLEDRVAVVTPARVDWYTQVKKESETTIELSLRSERTLGVELHFGSVSVTEQVVAYARKAIRDGATIDVVPMLMPETTFETEAIWFCPEPEQLEGHRGDAEAPRRAARSRAQPHRAAYRCGRCATAGTSAVSRPTSTTRPAARRSSSTTATQAGVGITERGFDRFDDWVEDTSRLLERCPCASGCPSCVQSPKCGNLNDYLDKEAARLLLRRMLA